MAKARGFSLEFGKVIFHGENGVQDESTIDNIDFEVKNIIDVRVDFPFMLKILKEKKQKTELEFSRLLLSLAYKDVTTKDMAELQKLFGKKLEAEHYFNAINSLVEADDDKRLIAIRSML